MQHRQGQAHPKMRALEAWAHTLSGIEVIDSRRTSSKSKKQFHTQLGRAENGRPDDADVMKLAAYGHEIVLTSGQPLRDSLGAFTITRGSVDGTRSTAVLGWAIPIGRTLFFLYLETARKFDIAGPSADQGANAFSEAIRAVVRGVRPQFLYTPLLSRIFRSVDHAVPTMRTLRHCEVRLFAAGEEVPLQGHDESFVATLRAAMAGMDAAITVDRLEGEAVAIYQRGEWYLGRHLLPFTWDTLHETMTDPATGHTVRREVDRHVIVPSGAAARDTLRHFVRLGGTPGVTRHALAIELGQRGVISRAPAHTGLMITLDRLQNPATAVATLCTRRWVEAFRTGVYRTRIRLTSDLRKQFPKADLVREDGKNWLAIEVKMPAPEGGWGITEAEWDAFEQQQIRPSRRGGRANTRKGLVRPLLRLHRPLEGGVERAILGFESSGYQLCERPEGSARDTAGKPMAWRSESVWVATVNCQAWHASIADQLRNIGVQLAGQLRPMELPVEPPTADLILARTETAHADAVSNRQKCRNRVRGVSRDRQTVLGDDDADPAERASKLAKLEDDEKEAETDLAAAELEVARTQEAVESARTRPQDDEDETLTADEHEANFSQLEAVIAGLVRYPATAPAHLATAVETLLGDTLRWRLENRGSTVAWNADVRLPLRDGSYATCSISGSVPTATGSDRAADPGSARQHRLPRRARGAAIDLDEIYARRFFLDGCSVLDIARERGVASTGGSACPIYRAIRRWLLNHGVASPELARAALDIPIASTRGALHRALTAGQRTLDPWEAHLLDIYTRGVPVNDGDDRTLAWGVLWMAGPMVRERRVFDILKKRPRPSTSMNAAELADLADIPYTTSGKHRRVGSGTSLLDMTTGGRPRRTRDLSVPVMPLFLAKDWAKRDTRPASQKHVALITCPHPGCRGHLQPVPVPEVHDGLLCDTCRRTPANPTLTFPREYLLTWSGGRRRRDQHGDHVGTHLRADN